METLGEFSCRDCRMDFHSLELLEKHKVFFCIGSDVGDPVALRRGVQERRDHRRDDGKGVYPKQAGIPDLVRVRKQFLIEDSGLFNSDGDNVQNRGPLDDVR